MSRPILSLLHCTKIVIAAILPTEFSLGWRMEFLCSSEFTLQSHLITVMLNGHLAGMTTTKSNVTKSSVLNLYIRLPAFNK